MAPTCFIYFCETEKRQENDDVCMHWSKSESATRRGTSATWRYCHIWAVAMQIPAARLRPRSATCIHDLAYRRMLDVAPQCTSYVLLFEYFVINDVIDNDHWQSTAIAKAEDVDTTLRDTRKHQIGTLEIGTQR